MKYAILFAFAAFAFLAQAQAKTEVIELSKIHDRGSIIDYLKEKLAAAKEKLEEILSKAQDELKKTLDEAIKKLEHLIDQLKEKAVQINKIIIEAVEKILDKLESSIAEIISKRSYDMETITECMHMKDRLHDALASVIGNASLCIEDKLEEAGSYIVDIYNFTLVANDEIEKIKQQGAECIRDVSGIKEVAAAIRCVAKVSAKATMVVGKTVPAVMIRVAKLITEVAKAHLKVPLCMPIKTLITLSQQVEPVVVGIQKCIQEKIEALEPSEESSEEVPLAEQTTEEEFHNEIPEEQRPHVQSNFGYEVPAEFDPIAVQM